MNHSYASNMGDAGFYIGACPDCSQVLENSRAQYSALGFSGTNAGGDFIIVNTEFDHNKTGLTSNSQNNDDQPSPQSGLCPAGSSPPVSGVAGCTIFEHNSVHDNNNANVPGNSASSLAGGSPVGAGIVIAGTRFVTLYSNSVYNNGSWGVLVTDLPDAEHAPAGFPNCTGGYWIDSQGICWYQAYGNAVIGNRFANNGRFGNPTNGDVALIETLVPPFPLHLTQTPDDPSLPGNCFHGNVNRAYSAGYLKSDPPAFPASETPSSALQRPAPLGWGTCGVPNSGNSDPVLFGEAGCNTQLLFPCPASFPYATNYPRPTKVTLSMPCATGDTACYQRLTPSMYPCGPDSWGKVPPANPWCPYFGPSSRPASTVPGIGLAASRAQLLDPQADRRLIET
jgi:hypothetical protein